jgi:hypothetical protein
MSLGLAGPAFALPDEIQTIVETYRAEKPVLAADLGTLMQAAERWCYDEMDGTCGWSDIYLDVGGDTATYQIGYLWDEDIETYITETIAIDGNRVCETGETFERSLIARHPGGELILGRELHDLRAEFLANTDRTIQCFDYIYLSASPADETVTLRQRSWTGEETSAADDAIVTLHFDPVAAAALTHRW